MVSIVEKIDFSRLEAPNGERLDLLEDKTWLDMDTIANRPLPPINQTKRRIRFLNHFHDTKRNTFLLAAAVILVAFALIACIIYLYVGIFEIMFFR
jgi:hypothetical protein